MTSNKNDSATSNVFSVPIRKLSAEELVVVVGGVAAAATVKDGSGTDNQGKESQHPR